MLRRDHSFFRFLYITTASVKCRVAAVKSWPYFTLMLLYISGPHELKIEYSSSRCQGTLGKLQLFHCPSCSDSIKPSLQFLYNFVVIDASERSLFLQILYVFCILKWNTDLLTFCYCYTKSFLHSGESISCIFSPSLNIIYMFLPLLKKTKTFLRHNVPLTKNWLYSSFLLSVLSSFILPNEFVKWIA
jgi:hypothetical protein